MISEVTITLGLVLALATHVCVVLSLRYIWKTRWRWPITYALLASALNISATTWYIPFFSTVVWPQ